MCRPLENGLQTSSSLATKESKASELASHHGKSHSDGKQQHHQHRPDGQLGSHSVKGGRKGAKKQCLAETEDNRMYLMYYLCHRP